MDNNREINKIVIDVQEKLGVDAVPEFLKVLCIAEDLLGELTEDTIEMLWEHPCLKYMI